MLLLSGCLLGRAPETSPPALFDAVHQDFADHYALFEVKGVDWDELADVGAGLGPAASDEELHGALTSLLDPLDDNHVHLLVPSDAGLDVPDWTSGVLHELEQDDFGVEVTLALLDQSARPHPRVAWGRLGSVGYVWIGSLGSRAVLRHLDDALDGLSGTDALILDLRGNGGGYDAVMQDVAARFVHDEPVFARTRRRASPTPGDLTDWRDLQVSRPPRAVREGPLVVLQHRFTVSAAEGLLLALDLRADTTFVGDVSSGAFGTVWWRELPNAWRYSLTVTDTRDAAGVSWEGVGLPVDVGARSSLDELRDGRDRALEAALEQLVGP